MASHFIAAPPAAVARVLATFDRRQIEGFIEVAINLLDFADGDPDLEPDGDEEEDDPSGEEYRIAKILPCYGLDQSNGPINYGEVERAELACELGLVRTSSGGWRKPA
jgi:hypothetical protein